ncbi:family 1 glycosylhydrolase [bacterium]|nr:family 1 glycosylhydrolase [bacterium]
MNELKFPDKFLFGTAVASYQVEGGIYNNDWTIWENKSNSVCVEPCNEACKHYEMLDQDIELLKELGIKAFRFSIEWSRIEPTEGNYDTDAINHYVEKAKKLIANNITPIITFHHFTTPEWLYNKDSWLNPNVDNYFENYVEKLMEYLPNEIEYFNTINEPGIFAFFGYFSTNKFPPGIANETKFIQASENIMSAHKKALKTIKKYNQNAKVGMTHALQEWEDDDNNKLKEYLKYHLEDKFLDASIDDDFIGLQTYTIVRYPKNIFLKIFNSLLLNIGFIRKFILPRIIQIFAGRNGAITSETRTTKMGYEYRPEAVLYNLRRLNNIFPDKEIFITENGIATDNDDERIEFVTTVLQDVYKFHAEHNNVIGYLYWSLLDNFEWDLGYQMNFGLVEVDKETYERIPHKSASWFGNISSSNVLSIK